jgi:hypothetical protein
MRLISAEDEDDVAGLRRPQTRYRTWWNTYVQKAAGRLPDDASAIPTTTTRFGWW